MSLLAVATTLDPTREDVERLALTCLLVSAIILSAAVVSSYCRGAQQEARRALQAATEALAEANRHMRQIAKDAYIDGFDRGVSTGYADGYEEGRRAPLQVVQFPERRVRVGDVGTATAADA